MKLNKYIGIAVMPMLFAACQNDMEDMQQKNQPIYTLSGIMDKGVNSRAQIQLGNQDESGEIFMWNEGDQFNLYQGGPESEVTFNISSSYAGNQSSATFSSETAVYPGKYVAVYPTVELDEENRFIFDFNTNLDFSQAVTQDEKNAVWKEYFKNNMYMIAQGELTMDGLNAVKFEQQCALVRITYQNMSESDQVLNYVSLCGENQFYGVWRRQNMDMMGWGASSSSWYQLNFNGLQVAAGESTDIYIFMFPHAFGENAIMEMYFSLQEGSDRSVKVPVSEIAANNGGANGFEAGMRYWFEVTSTKGGAVLSKHYSTKPIVFENTEFAAALQGVLGSEIMTIDEETGYGTMIEADVINITSLDFGYGNYKIESLDGIENFKNLNYLYLGGSGLKKCDMSQNTSLKSLYLGGNDLTSIDLSKNTGLMNLLLGGNENLTSVNLSGCKELQSLQIGSTGLTSLDVPFKGLIWRLDYSNTALSFNLEEFPGLTSLAINAMELESLDFIPAKTKAQLVNLYCYNNNIQSIDLAGFTNLENLDIDDNELTTLEFPSNSRLKELYCRYNKIQRLDISPLQNLNSLYCGNQNNEIMLELIANENQKNRWRSEWSNWSENYNAYLEEEEYIPGTVSFNNVPLARALQDKWGENAVEIDESGMATITKMKANTLVELNLEGYTGITSLDGLEVFPNLKKIEARSDIGLVGEFNFEQISNLEYLDLSNNIGITGIDVTKNKALYMLQIVGSQINSLDLTQNENLTDILVVETPLESLDLSKNLKLKEINCRANRMKELDITPFTLNRLFCGGQQDDITIKVNMTAKQKETWDSTWKDWWENSRVEVIVKE